MSGNLKSWPKDGLVGDWGYVVTLFVRLPQISIGAFNFTLGEITIPVLQNPTVGQFNCPMVNGRLTGDCLEK